MLIKHTLPWPISQVSPYISERIINLHFGKHHQGYVDKYNKMIAEPQNSDLHNLNLLEVLKKVALEVKSSNNNRLGLFRNGAQAWNHDFLWKSMFPSMDPSNFMQILKMDFTKFREIFIEYGTNHFASGWIWIVQNGSNIDLCTTKNEESPLFLVTPGQTILNPVDISTTMPLAVCDLWEHAYYLDYENNRKHYLEKFFDHLVNWDFVVGNFKQQQV